jgi:hypothetical protein
MDLHKPDFTTKPFVSPELELCGLISNANSKSAICYLLFVICHTIRQQPMGRGPHDRVTNHKSGRCWTEELFWQYQHESIRALSHGTRPIAQGQSVICYLSFVIPFGDSRMVSCPSARTLFRAGMLQSRRKHPRQPIARRRQHRPVECTG